MLLRVLRKLFVFAMTSRNIMSIIHKSNTFVDKLDIQETFEDLHDGLRLDCLSEDLCMCAENGRELYCESDIPFQSGESKNNEHLGLLRTGVD